jgi:hypothetical protein
MSSDRITWKFLLIFAFAGALKIFALFLFFPLVLLREKRILHALCDMLVGLLFVFLSLFPYAGRADYIQATSILNDIVTERMFSTTFPLGNADVPIFLPLLAGICIWAYVTKPGGREETFYRVNWIALAVYASFFIFVFAHPYWIILLVPYLVILVAMNPQNMKINLILEFFLSFCISLFYIATFGVYMTKDTFAKLVLPRIGFAIPQSDYSRLPDLVAEKEWELYVPVLLGIFAVCMIAFLILNRPDREHAGRWGEMLKEELRFDHGMIYLRLGAIAAFIAGCLWFAYGI